MSKVDITNQKELEDGWEFVVRTSAGTEHVVALDEDYYQQLSGGDITPAMLIEESFVFLLNSEPAKAILAEFNLQDIEDYFPHYPEQIKS